MFSSTRSTRLASTPRYTRWMSVAALRLFLFLTNLFSVLTPEVGCAELRVVNKLEQN